MSGSQYLIRFDDICPTMNWSAWEAVEALLVERGLRPILAVVPDNQDPKLAVDPPRGDFWERVRRWQAMGWTIAMHGYQHRYVTREAGLMDIKANSEFAGLPRAEQEEKLRRGLAIFAREGVRADAWVAPSHSFDATTVELLRELGVPVISDGHCPWPYADSRGLVWIPQQIWKFKRMPPGIWTVCFHHNDWTDANIGALRRTLDSGLNIGDPKAIAAAYASTPQTWSNRLRGRLHFFWEHRVRAFAWRLSRALKPQQGAA